MRTPIIAGNWKLHKNIGESLALVNGLKRSLSDVRGVDVVVCPVFTALSSVCDALSGSHIKVGAQDVYWEEKGAFTGEVSSSLIKDAGASYVIIGHSERRQFFHETHETVYKKTTAVLKNGLTPIVCVGELLSERESGKTMDVLSTQITQALSKLSVEDASKIIIAYEPVWAIGTGKVATPEQAEEAHAFIRSQFQKLFGASIAEGLRIQYGGSVKADNISDIIKQPNIDGALVGGASLDEASFSDIVKNAALVVAK